MNNLKQRRGGVKMDERYPIGKMEVPEIITSEDIQGWLKEIETLPTRLRHTVSSLSDEVLQSTYREGSWTVKQLVHHIADAQLNLYQRIKLALTVDTPSISAFDQQKWAILPDTETPLESSLKMMEGINERIVHLGRDLSEEELNRGFIHSVDGKVTVAETLLKCAWHANHHLAHIKIALEKYNSK